MAITAGQLNIKVATQGTKEAQASLFGISTELSGAQKKAVAFGMGAGLAVIGFGVASLKMAGDFQEGMTQLVTGAGESEKDIGMLGKAILQMAVDTGTSTAQLQAGLYSISSASFTGAAGLLVLKTAAEGAKVGNADLGTVAYALVGALNAYHEPATDAANVTNDLIATVANGNMHMIALATSLGAIMAPAAALNVPLDQVSAAIDTMTMQNTDASKATQALRFMLAALAGPTSAAAKEMEGLGVGMNEIPGITKSVSDELGKLGLHTSQVADVLTHQGLPAALKLLTDAIGKEFPAGSAAYNAALKAAVGGTRGFTAAQEISGVNAKTYAGILGNIDAAVKKGAGSVTNWTLVQGDFNFKMAQAKEVVETLMISIGQHLLPAATALAGFFVSNVAPAIQGFINLISTNHDAFTIFAGIIGTVLVGALVAAAIAAWMFVVPVLTIAAPVLAVVAAIGLMVIAFKLAYDHFGLVRIAVAALKIGFEGLIDGIKNIADHVGIMANIVGTGMHAILGFISGDSKAASIAAAQHADEMKKKVVDSFIDQQQRVVASEKDQRIKLLEQIAATTDPATKHALELKLGVLNEAIDMHDKAIKSAEDQRARIINHMKLLAEEAKHHADLMKMGVIGHIIEMKEQAVQWVQNMPPAVMAKLIDLKNQAIAKAQELVVGFIKWLVNLHNQAETEAGNIAAGIMGKINALPGMLLSAGANMIQALINGISSKIGAVKNVVGSIVSAIGNFFPHSPAKEGALVDLPNWGPRIVDTIAGGIVSGTSKVRAATGQLSGALALGMPGTGSSIAVSNAAQFTANGAPDQGVIQNYIMIDGRVFAEVMTRYQASYLRNSTGQVYG